MQPHAHRLILRGAHGEHGHRDAIELVEAAPAGEVRRASKVSNFSRLPGLLHGQLFKINPQTIEHITLHSIDICLID